MLVAEGRQDSKGGRMKKFIYEILLNFVDYLIKKFDIDEKEILDRYKKLKNKRDENNAQTN